MGGVQQTGGGGKRSGDAQVNLVPYIDLLMTIMTFLVMTAVWTKVADLEVQNATNGEPEEQEEEKEPLSPVFVTLTETGLKVQRESDPEAQDIAMSGNGYNLDSLKSLMETYKSQVGDRLDELQVKVKPEDAITYDKIITVVDVITGLEYKAITIEPATAGS